MIPADIKNTEIRDEFWSRKQALVRKEVIPYQWEILNDRIPEAEASYCMHNFKAAGLLNEKMRKKGDAFEAPRFTYRGFAVFPEKREDAKEDEFYGFVFQDSDFYKWIEAVGYALMTGPDPVLEETADRAIDIVCAAQLPNGYLDTYYIINGMDKSFSDLRDHHELYCLGHLIEGAISYYQATGKEKLLKTAERYADYVASLFGTEEGKINGYPGHEIAEMALFALYDLTGEERYKNLAEYFINERGKEPNYFEKEHPDMKGKPDYYHQAHIPVREQTEAVGHAVRAVYLYSGMADMARLTGDAALLNACEKLFDSIVNTKMYITGGIGATHLGESFSLPYDLPNDTAYSETCAAIGLVFFAERMLRIKADSKYADVMELALFNTVLSGMALDGKSFFYVNPLDVIPENCKKDERKTHVKPVRQKWFGCACCPPNIARLITSLGRYIYTEDENTLYTHLYVGSDTTKAVNGKLVSVSMESGFPNNGNVKIAVNGAKGSGFRLALRIPGWTNGKYRLDVTGASEKEEKDGYIYLGEFSESAAIDISFDMIPRLMAADSRVAEDNLKVAVTRGPIVYCMEGVDNGDKLRQIRIDKNVSFTEEMSGEFGYDVVTLKADAKRIIPSVSAPRPFGELYGEFSSFEEKEISLRLIPYYLWANRGENEMSVYINI
ncbi:MAG: glycoside hydrolase family 127 protein [Lachnospiraceae bacterium]|nr:glycoside hydrolase family 127 protein [Lachnospiraceae bacterium]